MKATALRLSPNGLRVWSCVNEDGHSFLASFAMGENQVIMQGDSLQAAYLKAFVGWCRMALGLRAW